MKNRGLNNLNASKEVGWEVGSQISDSHSRFTDEFLKLKYYRLICYYYFELCIFIVGGMP